MNLWEKNKAIQLCVEAFKKTFAEREGERERGRGREGGTAGNLMSI